MPSIAELKIIASLKSGRYRQKYDQFVVEGRKSVIELFHSSFEVKDIYCTQAFAEAHDLPFIPTIIRDEEYNKISQMDTPPGILAVAKIRQYGLGDLNLNEGITLALDGISDPGNLGTMLRTADWFGVKQIVLSKDCCDFYNLKCLSATMGSFTRVLPVYTELQEVLEKHHSAGFFMDGENIEESDLKGPIIMVIGNESRGIREETAKRIGRRIAIPGAGNAESLNAAVAAGIGLFEAWKQNR